MKHGLIRRLGRDKRGATAVEFALIMPILLMIYVGMVQVCQGFMADKRAGHAAAIVGDMIAQNATLNASQVENVLAAGDRIMRPFSVENLTIRVTSVDQTSGTPKVVWSQARGDGEALPPLSKGAEVELPAHLLAGGGPVIVTESQYVYQPLVKLDKLTIPPFSHTTYHPPRNAAVSCADC